MRGTKCVTIANYNYYLYSCYLASLRSGESTRLSPMSPGSNPDFDVICRLSLLLVLVPAPRVFLPLQKPKRPNSNSILEGRPN